MAKKSVPKSNNKRRGRNPADILIANKSKKFLEAEKAYWSHQKKLFEQIQRVSENLCFDATEMFPTNLSSVVWALKNGVAFVRYKTFIGKPRVEFRILNVDLKQWSEEGIIVPTEKGDLALAGNRIISGLGNFNIRNLTINDINISYLQVFHMKYGDENNLPIIEKAILDFQLTLMGMALQKWEKHEPTREINVNNKDIISKLKEIANSFEDILKNGGKEEILQKFIKENPFLISSSANAIPKQKLGEDFITDFVLVSFFEQGLEYCLVELERSDHEIINNDGSLTSKTNHAIKQIHDWDIWLEKNKGYLQNKLKGFETPNYLIVIGRSINLSEDQKAYLRSYNRDWKNKKLLTYDDLLLQFKKTIDTLEKIQT